MKIQRPHWHHRGAICWNVSENIQVWKHVGSWGKCYCLVVWRPDGRARVEWEIDRAEAIKMISVEVCK